MGKSKDENMKTEHSLQRKPKLTALSQRLEQLFIGQRNLHFATRLMNKYGISRNLTKWLSLIWLKLFGYQNNRRIINILSSSQVAAHYTLWFKLYFPALALSQGKQPGSGNLWPASNHFLKYYPDFIPGKQPGSSYLSRLVKNYPAVNYWELIPEPQLKSNYRWPLTNYFSRTNLEFIPGKQPGPGNPWPARNYFLKYYPEFISGKQPGSSYLSRLVKNYPAVNYWELIPEPQLKSNYRWPLTNYFSRTNLEFIPGKRPGPGNLWPASNYFPQIRLRNISPVILGAPGSRSADAFMIPVLDLLNFRPFNTNVTTPGQAGINQIGIYQTGNDKIALNHLPVFSRSNQEIITINFATGLFNGSRTDYQNSYIARARGGRPPHQPSGSTRYSPYLITRNKLNYQSYESYQSFNYNPFSQADRTSGSTRADGPKVSRYSANTRGNLHRYHNLSNQIVTNYPLAYRIGRAQILLNTANNPQLNQTINLFTLGNHDHGRGSEKSPFQTIRDQTGARENHPDILISGKPGGFNRLQPVVQSVNPGLEGQSKNHKFTQLEYSRNNIFQLQSEKQSSEARDILTPNSSGIMPGLASIALDNPRPGPTVIREPGTVNREQSNQFWRAITTKYPPASGPGFLNGFIHFQRGGNRQNLVTAWNVNRMVMLSHLLKTENSLTAMSTAQTIPGFNNSLASGPFFNPAELILRKTAAAESEINPETNEITVKPDKIDTSPQSSQNITLINNILQNIATRGGSFSAINVIANHVYQLIEKRIIIERDRRGLL